MEDKDFEKLLKRNICTELCIPDDLDDKTRLKMDKVIQKKSYNLILILIIINTLLIFLFSVYLWIISSTDIQRTIIGFSNISLISVLIFFYYINKQTYLKKEVKI